MTLPRMGLRATAATAIALGSGLAGGAVLASAPAGASTTLHFYEVQESMTFDNAQGQPITNPNATPAAGDTFDSTNRDYVGNNKHHASNWTATDHVSCTFTSISSNTSGTAKCNGQFAIGGSMLLADDVTLNFTSSGPGPVPINGGTGIYKGASGTLTSTSIGNSNNSNVTISLNQT